MKAIEPDERARLERLLEFERALWQRGLIHIAGVDEAGRGPLAGPVVAAAVVFPREARIAGWFEPGEAVTLLGAGALISRYERAAVTAGLRPVLAGAEVMIAGADRIARDYEARQNGT